MKKKNKIHQDMTKVRPRTKFNYNRLKRLGCSMAQTPDRYHATNYFLLRWRQNVCIHEIFHTDFLQLFSHTPTAKSKLKKTNLKSLNFPSDNELSEIMKNILLLQYILQKLQGDQKDSVHLTIIRVQKTRKNIWNT